MFQFSCRFELLSTFRLSNRTPENNANFDAKARANINEVNFFKHAPKLIIFGTHNLQTFEHDTLVNKLLKSHHRK